ncbi:MAG TPA: T9SS type A sorting domain-containing protein, partial [Cytophagales bacterium]|nr:T9SS type A sorting domain-containing protein [Cytophagales bacterium]
WTLKFANVNVPDSGIYKLKIGYQLSYEGPKTQKMFVNGVSQDVVFTAPNKTDWLILEVDVLLKKGSNEIRFETSWGYMAFDYISFAYEGISVGVKDPLYKNGGLVLHQNYPNPSGAYAHIAFDLPSEGAVSLELLNIQGQTVVSQHLGSMSQGAHVAGMETGSLDNGMYVLKLTHGANVVTRTMSIVK